MTFSTILDGLDLGGSYGAWGRQFDERADRVKVYRRYTVGEHDSNLTDQMRDLLRLDGSAALSEFNANYCARVINAMTDRLNVTTAVPLTADNNEDEGLNAWLGALMRDNNFDALQLGVYESALRDGDAFMLVSPDPVTGRVVLSVEPAFDGEQGMMVLYDNMLATQPYAAIKVWTVGLDDTLIASQRVNVYYEDRIEQYLYSSGSITPYPAEGSNVVAWDPTIGVPVRHLANQRQSYTRYGRSEIDNVIPLQNVLNRALYSLVAAAELTGFQIRVAKGFEPPAKLTPGMWVEISREGASLTRDDVADAYVLNGENPTAFIQAADWVIGQISSVSATPMEFLSASTASGEALKQREIALLGKIRRFQVAAGAFWQEVFRLAALVQNAFFPDTVAVPAHIQLSWQDAQIRNDGEASQVLVNVASLDVLDNQTMVELLAPLFGWNERQVNAVVQRARQEREEKTRLLARAVAPEFGQDSGGTDMPPPNDNELRESDTNG